MQLKVTLLRVSPSVSVIFSSRLTILSYKQQAKATHLFLTCCDGLNRDKDELFKDCINKHLGPGFGYIFPFVLCGCCCLKRISSRNVLPLVRNTFGWRIQRAGFQMAGAAPTNPWRWRHRGRWLPQHPGKGASESWQASLSLESPSPAVSSLRQSACSSGNGGGQWRPWSLFIGIPHITRVMGSGWAVSWQG